MKSSVQVRDGRGEYTPTEREKRNNMARLARDAIRQACRDTIAQRPDLPDEDDLPALTLSQEVYKVALMKLLELGLTAENDGHKIAALDALMRCRSDEMKLLAEMRGDMPEKTTKVVVVNSTDIAKLGEMKRESLKK